MATRLASIPGLLLRLCARFGALRSQFTSDFPGWKLANCRVNPKKLCKRSAVLKNAAERVKMITSWDARTSVSAPYPFQTTLRLTFIAGCTCNIQLAFFLLRFRAPLKRVFCGNVMRYRNVG
jgi:hypothetical protein